MKTDDAACEICAIGGGYEGFDCAAGGTTTESTPLLPGYWRPGSSYARLLECPDREGWCAGGVDGDICVEGESACASPLRADVSQWSPLSPYLHPLSQGTPQSIHSARYARRRTTRVPQEHASSA